MGTYVVDLWLDGYDTEEEMEDACEEFIYQQLNMTASAVTVDKYDYVGQLEAENKRLREYVEHRDSCGKGRFGINHTAGRYDKCTCGLDKALKESDDE